MESIHQLLYRYIIGDTTSEENMQLQEWAGVDVEKINLLKRLKDPETIASEMAKRELIPTERPFADMMARTQVREKKPLRNVMWIAASLIGIFGISAYLIFRAPEEDQKSQMIAQISQSSEAKTLQEINAGSTKAVLTSSTGENIRLTASDSVMENIENVINMTRPASRHDIAALSLQVPRGGEFKIILEDSTEVWLNSQSILFYPESFDKTERRVQLIGEAYFKVTRDEKRPFLVESNDQLVKVYGTTFNIRAYDDEPIVYTTLEQGSVSISRVDNPSGKLKINPGHQTLFYREDKKLSTKAVDPSIVTSWRHGLFVFEEQPLSQIMKDLSRWYDFDYEFSDPSLKDMIFMGTIPRYSDFVSAVSILEKIGDLEFSTSEGKVIISPKPQRRGLSQFRHLMPYYKPN